MKVSNKILFVSHSNSTIGGAEEDLRRLVFDVRNDYKVYLALPNNTEFDKVYKNWVNGIFNIRTNIPPLHHGSTLDYLKFYIKGFLQFFELRKIISDLNPDILIFNSSVLFLQGYFFKKYKQVFFIREYLLNDKIRNISYKLICRSASKVISVSSFISKELKKYCCLDVKTLYTSIEGSNIKVRKKLLVDRNTFNFLAVGIISPLKNQFTVLKAFHKALNKIEKAKLYFLGRFYPSDEYYRSMVEYINSHNLKDNVIFLGELDRVNALTYISQVNCIVIASLTEGMPNVISEALFFNKPLISSKFNGISDIFIDEYNGLLFDANNSNELTSKMIRISNEPKYREYIISNSKITYTENFSLEKNLLTFRQLLDSISATQ